MVRAWPPGGSSQDSPQRLRPEPSSPTVTTIGLSANPAHAGEAVTINVTVSELLPGNSSSPVASLPSYMGTLVATSV